MTTSTSIIYFWIILNILKLILFHCISHFIVFFNQRNYTNYYKKTYKVKISLLESQSRFYSVSLFNFQYFKTIIYFY